MLEQKKRAVDFRPRAWAGLPKWAGMVLGIFMMLHVTGCSSTTSQLTGVRVAPALGSILAGATQQFTATAVFTNGTSQDVTASATWSSSNVGVATVTGGTATGVAVGSSIISATYNGFTGNANLSVTPPTLTSISVTPANISIAVGVTQQYTATGTYSDGTTAVLTNAVWSSSTTTVATISTTGLATAVLAGTTTITATCGTISGSTPLTVTTTALVSIAVTPANVVIAVAGTQAYVATGTYADGTTAVLTTELWSSSNTAIATIDPTGLATGVAVGNTTITATCGLITGTTNLTVAAANGGSDALLTGQYALRLSGTDVLSNGFSYSFAASITTDGAGNVTTGEIDFADASGNLGHETAITGTYTIGTDGRGTITLNTGDPLFGVAGQVVVGVSLTSGTNGRIIEEDTSATGSGSIDQQTAADFVVTSITGPYAFSFTGYAQSVPAGQESAGAFTADGIGAFSNGELDVVTGGVPLTDQALTGTFTAPDLCGRGTATLNSGTYAYYVVDGTTLDFIENDGTNLQAGPVVTQSTATTLAAGTYAFAGGGTDYVLVQPVNLGGLITSDGVSLITAGTLDTSDGGTITTGTPILGSFTVDTVGRGVLALTGGGAIAQLAFYQTANDGVFLLETDGAFQTAALSLLQGTFTGTGADLTGPYAANYTGVPLSTSIPLIEHDLVGELTADGVSAFTGLADINVGGGGGTTANGTFTGTYDVVDATGRFAGTLVNPDGTTQVVEFYATSGTVPNSALFITQDTAQLNTGVIETQTFAPGGVRQAGRRAVQVPQAHSFGSRVPAAHKQAKATAKTK